MSYTPDLVTAVIRSLNRKNAVTRAVDPANVRLVSVVNRDEKTLDVTLAGGPGYASYGQMTAQVTKQNIADYFAKVPLKVIPTSTSIHSLLPKLETILGITFLPDDFEDLPIVWVDNTARITFQAKESSLIWYGNQTLDVANGDVDINTVYTVTNISLTLKAADKKQWVNFYSNLAKRLVDLDKVDVSAPMTPADIGQTSAYNSVVALTAKPGSGMFGTKYVFYSRNVLSGYDGRTTYVPDDFNGSLHDALASDTIGMRSVFDINEIAPVDTLSGEWPRQVQLVPVEGSYKVMGSATLNVARYQDNEQTLNLNYATMAQVTDSYWTSVLGNRPACGRLFVNVNVEAGGFVYRNNNLKATFVIDELPQIGEVVWKFVNRGTILGCGGSGMVYSLPANTLTDGADAIYITDAFRGKVTIENYGTIAGGGGGGDYYSFGSTNIGGAGGAPFGAGAVVSSGGNNRNGLAGSRDKGGATQLVMVQFTGYQSRYYGAPGGDWGQAGRYAVFEQWNTPAGGAAVYSYGREDGMSWTRPGMAGNAVGGNKRIVDWISVGTVKPNVTDEYQEFLDYLANLDANRMASADGIDKVTDPTKPVCVEFFGTSISGRLFIKQNPPGSLIGTPYGDAVANLPGTTLYGIMAHCVPEFDVVHDTWRYNRAVMFTLKPAPTGVISLSVTRHRVSSGISNAPVAKYYVDRFVYYDAYLGKMMECNPYTKSVPKPWVRPKTPLSQYNGELDGFKARG